MWDFNAFHIHTTRERERELCNAWAVIAPRGGEYSSAGATLFGGVDYVFNNYKEHTYVYICI